MHSAYTCNVCHIVTLQETKFNETKEESDPLI